MRMSDNKITRIEFVQVMRKTPLTLNCAQLSSILKLFATIFNVDCTLEPVQIDSAIHVWSLEGARIQPLKHRHHMFELVGVSECVCVCELKPASSSNSPPNPSTGTKHK